MVLIAECTINFVGKTYTSSQTDLENPSLLAMFHSSGRCYIASSERKGMVLTICEYCMLQYQLAR